MVKYNPEILFFKNVKKNKHHRKNNNIFLILPGHTNSFLAKKLETPYPIYVTYQKIYPEIMTVINFRAKDRLET